MRRVQDMEGEREKCKKQKRNAVERTQLRRLCWFCSHFLLLAYTLFC